MQRLGKTQETLTLFVIETFTSLYKAIKNSCEDLFSFITLEGWSKNFASNIK